METMIFILIKVLILISANPNIPQESKVQLITEIRQVVQEAESKSKTSDSVKPIEVAKPTDEVRQVEIVNTKPIEVRVIQSPVVEIPEPVIIKAMEYATIGTVYEQDGEKLANVTMNDSVRALVEYSNESAREFNKVNVIKNKNTTVYPIGFGHTGTYPYTIKNYDHTDTMVSESSGTITVE